MLLFIMDGKNIHSLPFYLFSHSQQCLARKPYPFSITADVWTNRRRSSVPKASTSFSCSAGIVMQVPGRPLTIFPTFSPITSFRLNPIIAIQVAHEITFCFFYYYLWLAIKLTCQPAARSSLFFCMNIFFSGRNVYISCHSFLAKLCLTPLP